MKTIKEINQKISKGEAVIVRADQMPEIYEENPKKAASEVDIVTTGTFGAMCSSGAFLNFGHADPPIKITRLWLNDVEAYSGIAAVDAYIGATQLRKHRDPEYGGAHVIEDLVAGREIEVGAEAYGTDCYPKKKVETTVTIDDLNQAIMYNPRNIHQRYNAATNSSDTLMRTYMGTLLPDKGNISFAGVGELNPLVNDPDYDVIGVGTRIFLGGAKGFIVGEGTQHSPDSGAGNLSTRGDLKDMDPSYVRGCSIPGYGTSLYLGIGVPIPVLNEEIARKTAVRNVDVKTDILDYGVSRLARPVVGSVNYEQLFSGRVDVEGRKIRTSPLSSLKITYQLLKELKQLIEDGEFYLTGKVQSIPKNGKAKPMKLKKGTKTINQVMSREVITAKADATIKEISELLINNHIDQIPIVDEVNKLQGIITSRDITTSLARNITKMADVMTREVITSDQNEALDIVSRRMDKQRVDATPVVDKNNKVIGIVTIADIMRKGELG
ncbi:MAG: homocysteine biosynthesis protein [Candidatus Altiarchaeota archaeon]|nr:homocysteine biosynthesis protein [Candidatus Altiarchaeota archaeon]